MKGLSPISIHKKFEYIGHKGAVFSLFYDNNSMQLYSGGEDGILAQWNPSNSTDGLAIANLGKPIWSLLKNGVSDEIFVGTSAGNIHVINPEKSNEERVLSIHQGGVFDIIPFKNGFLTGGGDGIVKQWDTNFELLITLKVSDKNIRKLIYNDAKKLIFAACSDGNIYVLNEFLQLIHTLSSHTSTVFALDFNKITKKLASGSRDATIKVWDIDRFALSETISAHWFHVHSLQFSPDGNLLASSNMDKSIRIWDANSFELLKVIDYERYKAHQNCVNKVLWIDANNLISCGDDRRILHFEIVF